MMENENDTPILTINENPFLSTLNELEKKLETEGSGIKEEIINLKQRQSDIYTKVLTYDQESSTRYGSEYKLRQERPYPYSNYGWSASQWKDEANGLDRTIYQKTTNLNALCQEYEATIVLAYFKYFELASATALDINSLHERYKKMVAPFRDSQCYYSERISINLSPNVTLSSTSYGEMSLQAFENLKDLASNYVNFSKTKGSSSNPTYYNYSIQINRPLPLITNIQLFDCFTWKGGWQSGNWHFSNLFEKSTIIERICLAITWDNLSLLKLFFEEYKTHYPDKSVLDVIANYALVGLAAANGCIEVMKLLITMEANLEQKFIFSLNDTQNMGCHFKSVLLKHVPSTWFCRRKIKNLLSLHAIIPIQTG